MLDDNSSDKETGDEIDVNDQTPQNDKKLNRRERRALNRKPQRSNRLPSTGFDDVDNPKTKYSLRGQPPDKGRFDDVYESGALDGMLGTNAFRKETAALADEQNAFVVWQAKQDEFMIYQNVGFDKEKEMDVWEPTYYKYYPLTVGDRLNLQSLEAEVNDLVRAITNNDNAFITSLNQQRREEGLPIIGANKLHYEKSVDYLKEQCARYLRMDVEKEFIISNYVDVVLAILSAKYAELHIPKYQKARQSSSTSKEKKFSGVT